MTTHKIDPAMVRELIPQLRNYKDYGITNDETHIVISFHLRTELFRFMNEFIGGVSDDGAGFLYIDLHRFKDMAIEWCAEKGYYIERKYNGFMGAKGMFDVGIALYQGNGCDEVRGFDYDPKTTSILSAELAAIDFCYKQIQEKNDA